MSSDTENNELELLAGLRAGSETALRRIFNLHFPLLVRDIYAYVPDEDTCKDIAQEVFMELWKKRETLAIHSSLRAYLRRAAINRALNFIKSNRRTLLDNTDDWPEPVYLPGEELQYKSDQEQLETDLHRAIEQLPEKCRLVFSLSRFEDLSHREISEQLGISVKTVENQITKAMHQLRAAMLKKMHLSPVIISVLKWWWAG